MNEVTNKNRLCRALVGSYLYGLETPSSDQDFKGVYFPSWQDCVLLNVDTAVSVDTGYKDQEQYFSLQHFFRLLGKGEVVCFDLLHVREPFLKQTSLIWEEIYKRRQKFYSKKLNGFLGFVLSQTRKYSMRGTRYNSVSEVVSFLQNVPHEPEDRLERIWDKLPQNEFAEFSTDSRGNIVYSVCERMVHPSVKIDYAAQTFTNYKIMYGERSKAAAKNEGYDLKSISHAFRCLDEVEQIVDERDLTFPLKNREFILKIKTGQLEINDGIFEMMEERVSQIKEKINKSDLPDHMDREYWNGFLINKYYPY